MMTYGQALLGHLQEECGEVGIMASKAMRFGLDEVWVDEQNPYKLDNEERLDIEINDVYAVLDLLKEFHRRPIGERNELMIEKKKAKIKQFLDYSRKLGMVE